MTFNLFLIVFFIGGWAASRLTQRLRLPGVLGMLFFGIALGTVAGGRTPPLMHDLEPFLKSTALIVILLRAGLGIRRATLEKVGPTAALMAFIPCVLEVVAAAWMYRLMFGFDWTVALTGAAILGAVSPAVVVPSMIDLKNRGFGSDREVPTIILAGASVDDVVAITLFTAFLSMAVGGAAAAGASPETARAVSSASMPLGRAAFGIALAFAGGAVLVIGIGLATSAFFARYHAHIRATEKTLLLLMVALLAVEVGNAFHIAALLTVMVVGFVLLERSEHVAHQLALKLGKVWVIAEIVLFVLIGMAVDPRVAVTAGARGLAVLGVGLVARSIGVLIAVSINRHLTAGERLFCVLAYLPKATVQAALGSVPLAAGVAGGAEILAVSVLAIVVTAPLGLALIRGLGPRLLGPETAR